MSRPDGGRFYSMTAGPRKMQDYADDNASLRPRDVSREGREPPAEVLLQARVEALKARDADYAEHIAAQHVTLREREVCFCEVCRCLLGLHSQGWLLSQQFSGTLGQALAW